MAAGKDHSINISASVIVSWLGIAAFAWLFAEPLLMNTVSVALAADIKQTVAQELAPINGAFIALLQRDINVTRKEIAAFKYRQRRSDNWTQDDAETLVDKEIELGALVEAKAALETANDVT